VVLVLGRFTPERKVILRSEHGAPSYVFLNEPHEPPYNFCGSSQKNRAGLQSKLRQ